MAHKPSLRNLSAHSLDIIALAESEDVVKSDKARHVKLREIGGELKAIVEGAADDFRQKKVSDMIGDQRRKWDNEQAARIIAVLGNHTTRKVIGDIGELDGTKLRFGKHPQPADNAFVLAGNTRGFLRQEAEAGPRDAGWGTSHPFAGMGEIMDRAHPGLRERNAALMAQAQARTRAQLAAKSVKLPQARM